MRIVFSLVFALAAGAATAPFAQPLSESGTGTGDGSLLSAVPSDPIASAEDVAIPGAEEPQGEPEFYRIRVGDTLTVSVLEDPNLTRTVLVRPDGRISLPIAGSVLALGVTPEDLEVILQERFSRGFQITPTVTVSIRGLSGQPLGAAEEIDATQFFMLGSVPTRGPIQVVEEVTVLEALMLVGGPTDFAAKDRIQIRRIAEDGTEQIFMFDWEALEEGRPITGNIPIQEGDIIFVPERGLFD